MTKKQERLPPIPKPAKRKPPRPDHRQSPRSGTTAEAAPSLDHISPDLRSSVMPVSELAFLVGNPMLHPDDQLDEIEASFKRWGQLQPLVVNTAKSPPEIIGGNGRLAVALRMNWGHVAVVRREMTDADARALTVVLNATQSDRWDAKLLAELMKDGPNTGNDPVLDAILADLCKEQHLFEPAKEEGSNQQEQPQPSSTTTCPSCGHQWT